MGLYLRRKLLLINRSQIIVKEYIVEKVQFSQFVGKTASFHLNELCLYKFLYTGNFGIERTSIHLVTHHMYRRFSFQQTRIQQEAL